MELVKPQDVRIQDIRVPEDGLSSGGLQIFRARDGSRLWPRSSVEDLSIVLAPPREEIPTDEASTHSAFTEVLAMLRFQNAILAIAETNPRVNLMGSRFTQGFLDGLSTLIPTAMELATEYIRDRLNR